MILAHLNSVLVLFILTTHAQSTNNLKTTANHECYMRNLYPHARNGRPHDCADAIITGLPSDPEPGIFTHDNRRELFQLPRKAISRTCEVTVDLVGVNPVQASWLHVWTMAHLLITACQYQAGGYIDFGPGQGLRVVITGRTSVLGNTSEVATA